MSVSLVSCPSCGGTQGVYRVHGEMKVTGGHKQIEVDVSDKFHCVDCDHKFTARGYAAGNEMAKARAASR